MFEKTLRFGGSALRVTEKALGPQILFFPPNARILLAYPVTELANASQLCSLLKTPTITRVTHKFLSQKFGVLVLLLSCHLCYFGGNLWWLILIAILMQSRISAELQ